MHDTEMEIKNPSKNVKVIALVEGTPGEEKTPFVLIGETRKGLSPYLAEIEKGQFPYLINIGKG